MPRKPKGITKFCIDREYLSITKCEGYYGLEPDPHGLDSKGRKVFKTDFHTFSTVLVFDTYVQAKNYFVLARTLFLHTKLRELTKELNQSDVSPEVLNLCEEIKYSVDSFLCEIRKKD